MYKKLREILIITQKLAKKCLIIQTAKLIVMSLISKTLELLLVTILHIYYWNKPSMKFCKFDDSDN